ncbi:MAG TPA: amidohydrolase family protein [Pirellulaceae bacterium]
MRMVSSTSTQVLSVVILISLACGVSCRRTSAGSGTSNAPAPSNSLSLEQFRPKPNLNVESHRLKRAKFPVVDVHTHFQIKLRGGTAGVDDYVRIMDRNGIAISVSLDGRLGDEGRDHERLLWTKYKDRFLIFAAIDWLGDGKREDPASWDCNQPDFARRMREWLQRGRERGVSGVKVFKELGLEVPRPNGTLAPIDDPRWDPIWESCGSLGLPVLMHVADPAAFFLPLDATNERWEELHRHPEWSFHDPRFPRREQLFRDWLRVVARHPATTFVGAHMANNPENLAEVAGWLDAHPNLYVELASRIGELGRQPYTAREFLTKYADRVLFGTDGPWPEQRLRYYWRFLETRDEYFPYSEKSFPPQGFWRIYGTELPDAVLRKIYHENAIRIIPGARERLERLQSVAPPRHSE